MLEIPWQIFLKESAHLSSLVLITPKFIFHYQSAIILVMESMPVLKELSFVSVHEANVYLGNFAKRIQLRNKIYFESIF